MSLIKGFEDNSTKKPYQIFEIRDGIDRFSVLIPLANADQFEQRVAGLKNKKSIVELTTKLNGQLR